jgi:exonuclease SbcC
MVVGLTFDLDGDRYLVERRFIKRNKRGVTELDLQVFDPRTKAFRPLTDSTSAANTQRQIDSLLCMDYTTFVNSAFIMQGRDAEFTQKTPRERKQVLAEILGLSRYDRLQRLAKDKFNLRSTEAEHCQSRIAELDDELSCKSEHETALGQVIQQLAAVDGQLELDTANEKTADQAVHEARTRAEEASRLRIERPQLEQRITALGVESADLATQEAANRTLLATAQTIESDFATYETLKSEENELVVKSQQRWQLSQAQVELEGTIRDMRHRHERERERLHTQKTALARQLAECELLISEQSRIETAYAALCSYREREDELKVAQQEVSELELERSRLSLHIDSTQKGLEAEALMVLDRHAEVQRILRQQPAIDEELTATNRELDELGVQTEDMETLREQGATLAAEIERDTDRLQETLEQLSELSGRARVLGDSPDADCPLCGSPLDREHREHLEGEMFQRKSACEAQIAQLTEAVAAKSAEVTTRRAQFQDLVQLASRILPLQSTAAQLQGRSEQFNSLRSESERLGRRQDELNGQLEAGDFAAAERDQRRALEQRMAESDFDGEKLRHVQSRLRDLTGADAERRLLEEAHASKQRILAELHHAEKGLEHTEQVLVEESFAVDERAKLSQILEDFAELAYDTNRHETIRDHLSDLAQIVQLSERLDSARKSQPGLKAKLERLQRETNELKQKLEVLDRKLSESAQQEATIPNLEVLLETVRARLKTLRSERDLLLARRGSVEGVLDRFRKLSLRRAELKTKLAAAERERWIYARLDEAFGKDGIQALIIEGAIPEIEREANALLSRLTDNRIQISLESLKDLKSGATRETLDIKIADELGERAYSLYSGGEAFRTNFALRVALSKVLARRSGTRLRTLIIDEGFGTQDGKGLESMIEAIQEISHDFEKILVVTHLPVLRDAFPTQIHVTKDPQYGSTLQLIQSAGG